MTKDEKKQILQALLTSCEEGIDGSWDCTRQGFEDMIQLIDSLADAMLIKLERKEYHYARVCDECKKGMNEGYMVRNGDAYYCGDACLYKHYSIAEWSEIYDEGHGDGFYTGWVSPEDMEWVGDIDGNIIREL